MKQKDENIRYIPLKNYILFALMVIAVILITLYIFKWYQIKNDEKASQSYLIENKLITKQISSFDEVKDVLYENSSKLLLYVSYRNSNKIYNIEKNYKDIFKEYNLSDMFYLFDITDIKDNNKKYKDLVNDYLDINVNGYPVIIYYEGGQISSYKRIKSSKDLKNFIKKIKIEKNSQ